MFGYRIALDVTTGVGEFLNKIVQALVRFIIGEKIAQWIAEQGGWVRKQYNHLCTLRFFWAVVKGRVAGFLFYGKLNGKLADFHETFMISTKRS